MTRPGMYYTPKEIIDPPAGSGKFLSDLSNPPFGTRRRRSARRLFYRLVVLFLAFAAVFLCLFLAGYR